MSTSLSGSTARSCFGCPRCAPFERAGQARPYRVRYDGHGEVSAIEHRGGVTRVERDAEGRPRAVVDAAGRRTTLTRDAAGRVVAVRDPFGRTVRLALDAEGRERGRSLFGTDGERVRSVTIARDAYGRPTRHEEARVGADGDDTIGRVTRFEHDATGRLSAALGDGVRLGIESDLLGRIAALTQPDGTRTERLYDALGRPAGLLDARGNATRELHDDFGALVGTDSPDSGIERLERDAGGHVVRRVREDSGVTTYRRDAAGRALERRDRDGALTVREYDAGLGRVTRVSDAAGTERFGYDAEGRLVSHVRELDGHRFETAYAYDGRGRLDVKTLPDGQRLHHHYHESGPNGGTLRAITRARRLGLGRETLVAEIDLEGRDGASGHLSGGGVRTERTYAADGTLRTLEVGGVLAASYRFDAGGRIVAIEEEGGARQRYAYTGGRLTSALSAAGTYRYAYDAAGNRTEREIRRPDGTLSHERATYAAPGQGNRLLGLGDVRTGATRPYRYDAGGSPTRAGELGYDYDTERRPVAVYRDGTLVARYAYNAFGERVKKVVYPVDGAPRVTYFLYDGHALVAEADGAGTLGAQYLYLPDGQPVAMLEGREAYAIHADHRGAPRLASDAEGRIVWRASYTPFGEARVEHAAIRLPLRLAGQYADAESGTHYNYYRHYDAGTGRYLTSDPIGLLGGANTYAYLDGDPLGDIDPLGLAGAAEALVIGTGGAVAGSTVALWLATVAQAGAAAAVLTGGGIVVVALAVYFYSEYADRSPAAAENAFSEEFGKPGEGDYAALQRELQGYASWLGAPSPAAWDGGWGSYFEMARQLEDAQRTYLAEYEALYGAGGMCPTPSVQGLYEGAVAAIAAADAAPAAEERDEADAPIVPEQELCKPCRTTSGRIIPVGTVAYRPLDVLPNDVVQHGVAGSHHNIFIAKQNPNNCQCFWQKQKYVLKPEELPAGSVPIEPFAN